MAYPLLVSVVFDVPMNLFVRILISPLFIWVSLLCVTAGYGLWEMKRWAWYTFFASHFFLLYANLVFGWDYGTSHHKGLAFGIFTSLQVLVFYRVTREIRVPYFFPRIRWWETDPRYRLSVPVKLVRIGGAVVEGDIMDISMGGCFVKVRSDLLQDELLSLRFSLFEEQMYCDGFVVWRTQSTVTHPRGIGIKFTTLGKREKKSLKGAIRRLRLSELKHRQARLSELSAARRIRTDAKPSKGSSRDG